jgi:peptide deformylase
MKEVSKKGIVQNGDGVLRTIAEEVTPQEIGSKELNKILSDMKIALEGEGDGVAIAAPQIGVPLRIFIVSHRAFELDEEDAEGPTKSSSGKDMVVINPIITKLSKKKVKVPEGCLSVRWLYGNTIRHEKATVRGFDEFGKPFTYGGSGLIAQIFQHETDHLNGILFIDHATDIEELTPEEIAKVKKESEKVGH